MNGPDELVIRFATTPVIAVAWLDGQGGASLPWEGGASSRALVTTGEPHAATWRAIAHTIKQGLGEGR